MSLSNDAAASLSSPFNALIFAIKSVTSFMASVPDDSVVVTAELVVFVALTEGPDLEVNELGVDEFLGNFVQSHDACPFCQHAEQIPSFLNRSLSSSVNFFGYIGRFPSVPNAVIFRVSEVSTVLTLSPFRPSVVFEFVDLSVVEEAQVFDSSLSFNHSR
jgi:hypothetical protein